MSPKPLSETNPYLKDPAMRAKLIARSVRTSGGVEGIQYTSLTPQSNTSEKKSKKIHQITK